MMKRDRVGRALLVPAFLIAASAAVAQEYPARPVRMVIPFPAGGPADYVGRLYAQNLSELWRMQIVTDNRTGASGVIGTEIAIRSNPDGYTLLFGSASTFAVNVVLIPKLPYDVFRDLEVIGLVAIAPHVVAVRGELPAKSVKELVALAKKQPGKLTFASAGAGTIVHMAGELFKHQAGIDIVHIPFKGGAQATVGVLAGEVDMVVNDLSAVLPHLKGGRMRALAAAHSRRLKPVPDVPTVAEGAQGPRARARAAVLCRAAGGPGDGAAAAWPRPERCVHQERDRQVGQDRRSGQREDGLVARGSRVVRTGHLSLSPSVIRQPPAPSPAPA